MKNKNVKYMMTLGMLAVVTAMNLQVGVYAQPAPLVEASQAQAAAGTVGPPFYMSPRRSGGNGIPGTSNTAVFVTVYQTGSETGITFTNLQDAVNSLASGTSDKLSPGGGRILLSPGFHDYPNGILFTNNNIAGWRIEGAGQFSTFLRANSRVITVDTSPTNDAPLKFSISDMAIVGLQNVTNYLVYINHCLPDIQNCTFASWIALTNNGSLGLQPGLIGTAMSSVPGLVGIFLVQNQADGGQILNCNFAGLSHGIVNNSDHLIIGNDRFDCIGVGGGSNMTNGVTLWPQSSVLYIPCAIVEGNTTHKDCTVVDCHWFACYGIANDASAAQGTFNIVHGEVESCTFRVFSFSGGGVTLDTVLSGTDRELVSLVGVLNVSTTNPPTIFERSWNIGNKYYVNSIGGVTSFYNSLTGTTNTGMSSDSYRQFPIPSTNTIIATDLGSSSDASGSYTFLFANSVNGCIVYTNIVLHVALVYLSPAVGTFTGKRFLIGTGTNDVDALYYSTAAGSGPLVSVNIQNNGSGLGVSLAYLALQGFNVDVNGNATAASWNGNGGGLTNLTGLVAFSGKPGAVTVGGSPFTYLNSTAVPLQVWLDDGAAFYSISLNGVSIRTSLSGAYAFILGATNSIVLTYPVTSPTFNTNKLF